MKQKRRQELKTNDLAQAIEDLGAWFNEWGMYFVGGIAAVAVVLIVVTYMKDAERTALGESYSKLEAVQVMGADGSRKSDEELSVALEDLKDLARNAGDAEFKLDALLRRGNIALALSTTDPEGFNPKFLPEAKDAFEEIVNSHKDYEFHYARALYGLYQVEANLFAGDGDVSHKDQARKYLEQIRDDSRLANTPFMKMALEQINELDKIFTVVKFPPRPTPPPQPEAALPGPVNIEADSTGTVVTPPGVTVKKVTPEAAQEPAADDAEEEQSVETESTEEDAQ